MRYPTYFRTDLSARLSFDLRGAHVVPYAGLVNLTGRPNVVYYEVVAIDPDADTAGPEPVHLELRPNEGLRLGAILALGLEVRF